MNEAFIYDAVRTPFGDTAGLCQQYGPTISQQSCYEKFTAEPLTGPGCHRRSSDG
jgi:hypothetical protein